MVRMFRSGEAYHTGRADEDPEQLRGLVEGLGVRSEIAVPLKIRGERRGVLSVVSLRPDVFTAADLQFVMAFAGWIGIVAHRAELFESASREATRRELAVARRYLSAESLVKLTASDSPDALPAPAPLGDAA